ncbi:MAG: xanthine dehydrogenase family protein molybdopterin-binding subunit [Rhodospirillales bacterium]|nr:xanthine dehydrogenase family protein molybdopterin-binding subunit [Rhodospirillales bacterium]
MPKFAVSQPAYRTEDARFLTGTGRYTDDITLPGQVHGVVVRSPFAHARIRSLSTDAARGAPGVVGVVTGADLEAEDANTIPTIIPLTNRDGTPAARPLRPVLCTETVRHVGDGVAFVVAETVAQAKDAAERVDIDYEPLQAVAQTGEAMEPGRVLVHDGVADNLVFDWATGDVDAVVRAFDGAAHVTRVELVNNRVVVCPIETRGVVAEYDGASATTTVHTGNQGGWLLRDSLARHTLKVAPEQVRVVCPDVGGAFGVKIFFYPEQAMAAWTARLLARPVKWMSERGEAFLSDAMGRDHVTLAELAFDTDHRILGMRVETVANLGAYLSTYGPLIPTGGTVKVLPGVYDVKCLSYAVRGVFTNTQPVDAYRGAGRPEAIYVIERLIDRAARELGLDAAELRRRNFISPAVMPFVTASGETYDSGEFERLMDDALVMADRDGFETRRAEARKLGARRGLGLCFYVESTVGEGDERADIRFTKDGTVELLVGTQSTGQGHETAYAQLLGAQLGIAMERIRVVQGDTGRIPTGGGTHGSRSLTKQGWAIFEATRAVIEQGRHHAAEMLEATIADIEFADGAFRIVGTDRAIALLDLAAALDGGLDGGADITVEKWTYPNGCHVAEVEIDEETGVTRLVRYSVVDDFGHVLNPAVVAGQVHGGVAQGIGQALFERTVYDGDGQLITGSLMDYCLARADDLPFFDAATVEVPCLNNPLGVKGCGEAGAIAAPAAVINAIIDALADLGIDDIDMPATPERLWRLMRDGREGMC